MDSHSHFHVAGRKGTRWESLYTGVNSIAYETILKAAFEDASFDEVRPCAHITPGHIAFPKQTAELKKAALANVRLATAEEIAAEREAIEENKRRQDLREAEHAVKILYGHEPTGKDGDTQKKLEADIVAAQSKVAAIKQAHADLAERKAIDAELSQIMIEDAARSEKAAALQDRRKQLSTKK